MRAPASASDHLRKLRAEGVGVWLNGLDRTLLTSGVLDRLVTYGALTGVTALARDTTAALGSDAYQPQLSDLVRRGIHPDEAARRVLAFDARWACEVFLRRYEADGRRTGLVSVETAPTSPDTLLAEARAARWVVDRPNLLIKVPAGDGTLPVVSELVAEGIGVDVTGVVSPERCAEALDAVLEGLERALVAGLDLSRIGTAVSAPVAAVDQAVDSRLATVGVPVGSPPRGRAARALARLVYRVYELALDSERWSRLAAHGARPPHVVWADAAAAAPSGLLGTDLTARTDRTDRPEGLEGLEGLEGRAGTRRADSTCVTDGTAGTTGTARLAGATGITGRYTGELVAWGVTSAVTLPALEAVATQALPHGDTLSGRHAGARHDLEMLADFGVRYGEVAQTLERDAENARLRRWRALRDRLGTLLSESALLP